MLFDEINISTDTLLLLKNRPALQRQTRTDAMDRHEDKEERGKKERPVAHFSNETPKLCIHTASSCCVTELVL